MVKDDLIYDWRRAETHIGYRLLAIVLAAGVFIGVGGLVKVRTGEAAGGVLKMASVLRFSDDELGRYWELKAEEDGPFPGRLELPDPEVDLFSELRGTDGWNTYQITPEPLLPAGGIPKLAIASKGTRYFPKQETRSEPEGEDLAEPAAQMMADKAVVLTPSDPEGLDAIPEEVPVFTVPLGGNANPGLWRFLVSLRADGTVDHCVSLTGETDETLSAVTGWLRTVRFNEGEENRWLGLQMEFVGKEAR